jgi:hypothetical protein
MRTFRRRTAIQSMVAAASAPFQLVRAWAQTATFPGKRAGTLHDLAAIVLPESLGRRATDAIADRFAKWVREYKPGAELEPGYGNPRLRFQPSSPAPLYLTQLESLAKVAPSARRSHVEAALAEAKVAELAPVPDGKHVASDLMSFYFFSSAANDWCYRAAVRKYECRGLGGSENPPPRLS